ncbi:GNAT family N-acetyltransferase [Nocardioides dubius]|uniref:N-acetyltransferase domain-containing protein n=1 Tax=Nocardioides dubius TaxID=317019 RepID=A0ABN1U3W1_9ACTN
MLELRVVDAADWQIWRGLRLAALAEAPGAFGATLAEWQGVGDREDRWRARLSIPGGRDLIALLDGQPVAMASGVPGEAAGTTEVISMWVSPLARGRGVSGRLLDALGSWSIGEGAHTLVLAVRVDNTAAINAYRSAGFTVVLDADGHPIPNVACELTMTRPLPSP